MPHPPGIAWIAANENGRVRLRPVGRQLQWQGLRSFAVARFKFQQRQIELPVVNAKRIDLLGTREENFGDLLRPIVSRPLNS